MSDFSEKLSFYITQSGYNVYQLAKEASLDRTTLQKTAKGQRLPSFDYIKDICRYIKISKKQEEELFRLYQIEKMGRHIVESWEEINQLLVDVQKLREKSQAKNSLQIHFNQESFAKLNEEGVQVLSSEAETVKAIMCMIEQEIMEEDAPEIYMNVSWSTQYVLSQLEHCMNNNEKTIICHQLVNFQSRDCSRDGLTNNFRILHQVLPYAFTLHNDYDIRYAIVAGDEENKRYSLWPYYIVTHRHVLLCSEEKYHAVLLSSEKIASCYRTELERMAHSYRPLFIYQGFTDEGISTYRKMTDSSESYVICEDFPSIALMVSQEIQEEFKRDPKLGKFAEVYFRQPKVAKERFIHIFGMKGMKRFIQTGHMCGVFDDHFSEIPLSQRKDMVKTFYNHLLNRSRRFYMANEKELNSGEGFGIGLCGKNKVLFYSTSKEFPCGFISIDEPGICEVFSSYFDYLLESSRIYSAEETIKEFEKIVIESFQEIE